MRDSTDRATTEEKAEAWDLLMRVNGGESLAVTEAWCFLRDLVEAREAHQQRLADVAREYGQDPDSVIAAAQPAVEGHLRVVSD